MKETQDCAFMIFTLIDHNVIFFNFSFIDGNKKKDPIYTPRMMGDIGYILCNFFKHCQISLVDISPFSLI